MMNRRCSTSIRTRVKNDRAYPFLKVARGRLGTLHATVEKLVELAEKRPLSPAEAEIVRQEVEHQTR
jgi:hypothetical protein